MHNRIPALSPIAAILIAAAALVVTQPRADGTAATAPAVSIAISGRLIEDFNENGVRDDGEGDADAVQARPIRTIVQLIPWSRVPNEPSLSPPKPCVGAENLNAPSDVTLELWTANDGSFSFINVLVGDYTLRVWWAGGFVSGGTTRLPDMLRVVFRVEEDGSISVPSPLPATHPESFGDEPFEPAVDGTNLGAVPAEILLKRGRAYVDTSSNPCAVGVLDVGAVVGAQQGGVPALPAAGQREAPPDISLFWLSALGLAVALLAAVAFSFRRAH